MGFNPTMPHDTLFTRLLNERLRERELSASDLARMVGRNRSTVSRWLNGETMVEPEMLPRLADCLAFFGEQRERLLFAYHGQQPTSARTAPFAPGTTWAAPSRMDLPQNPLFVGREEDLAALVALLQPPLATVAIAGMAGVGKTQLATELVYRMQHAFPGGVFWLRCADVATLPAEVAACATPLGFGAQADRDMQIQQVLEAWRQPVARLLVFDNCEDEALIRTWRPPSGGCRIIVTSRRRWWSPMLGVQVHRLAPLLRQESVTLLRRLIGQRSQITAAADQQLALIAAELGDLPLALSLAGHFLSLYGYRVTPAVYLQQISVGGTVLISHPSLHSTGRIRPEERQLALAIALSYDQLDPQVATDALALALLARIVWCAPGEPVNISLLVDALAYTTPALQVEDALLRLSDELGLVERMDSEHIQAHRLIVAFVRAHHPDTTALRAIAQALLGHLTIPNMSELPGDPQWLRHLHALADARFADCDVQVADLCYAMGEYLWWGQDPAAARYWERASTICAEVYGTDDIRVATCLNGLGLSLHLTSEVGRAVQLFAQAIAIRAKHLPTEHFDLLMSQGNLGFAQMFLGDYAAAETTIREVQQVIRRRRGLRDHHLLRNVHNRGVLRLMMGRYRAAYRLLRFVCRLREELLSPSHPALAKSYTYLGEVLARLGDGGAAEHLQQKALAIRTRLYGDESHVPAENWRMQGIYLMRTGDTSSGLFKLERALTLTQQHLVPGHDEITLCLEALGIGYWYMGAVDKAQALLIESLACWGHTHGVGHVHSAVCLHMLGILAWFAGQSTQAATFFERSLHARATVLPLANSESERTNNALIALQAGNPLKNSLIPWPTILPL
jgi:tetratricopeptide (TPR) repeat protein/transcriptional regulator with XRE-family HTH domain